LVGINRCGLHGLLSIVWIVILWLVGDLLEDVSGAVADRLPVVALVRVAIAEEID
jgi:hypothetical protein